MIRRVRFVKPERAGRKGGVIGGGSHADKYFNAPRRALESWRFRCCGIRRLQHDADRRRSAGGARRRDCASAPSMSIRRRWSPTSAIRPRAGRSRRCPARSPRPLGRAWRRATPARRRFNVRIDTLYLGGGGPGDPDRIRGVATLGGHTISVRASVDIILKTDRSGAAGAGFAGPGAGAGGGVRLPAEEEARRLSASRREHATIPLR